VALLACLLKCVLCFSISEEAKIKDHPCLQELGFTGILLKQQTGDVLFYNYSFPSSPVALKSRQLSRKFSLFPVILKWAVAVAEPTLLQFPRSWSP